MSGAIVVAMGRVIRHPSSFRFTSMIHHHLEQVCWRAVPIVVLITFLIGCIIAQQSIFQLRKFGADVFVVDMLGVLVLRVVAGCDHGRLAFWQRLRGPDYRWPPRAGRH